MKSASKVAGYGLDDQGLIQGIFSSPLHPDQLWDSVSWS